MQNQVDLMGEVYFALCKGVDTPLSLGAWMRYKYGQFSDLASLRIHPEDYLCPLAFEKDYLVTSYVRKYKGLDTGIDLEAVALRKFIASEDQCRETNRRIRAASTTGNYPSGVSEVLHLAQRKIASVLGPFSWLNVQRGCGWGPGAAYDVRRSAAFLDTKMLKLPISVTSECALLAEYMIKADLHWSSEILGIHPEDILGDFCFYQVLDLVDECRVEFVPKDATTHRSIAVESRLNGFLQKGFGQFIRRRLKRVGIDLASQEHNQSAAKAAYTDALSTLDLASASDTVATELVHDLLPPDWACALEVVRSKAARLPDGQRVRLEKFSSMGNGFTFELETLIFWALAASVTILEGAQLTGKNVLVYGDDIIVPRSCAHRLIRTLEFCGFTTNASKSFLDGDFFESCGKHFFKGYDVTPIYQKECLELTPRELVRAGNRLMRYALRSSNHDRLNKDAYGAWQRVWRAGGPALQRYQLPLGAEGDDGWLLPASLFRRRPSCYYGGIDCRVMKPVPKRRFPASDAAFYAHSLRTSLGFQAITPLSMVLDPTMEPLALPYDGYVEKDDEKVGSAEKAEDIRPRSRFVMPGAEFGASW